MNRHAIDIDSADMDPTGPGPNETRERLESEVSNVATAIALVASGAATRVTVSGLRFGDQLTARFRGEAATQRISVEPLYWPDDAGCDVVVARAGDARRDA